MEATSYFLVGFLWTMLTSTITLGCVNPAKATNFVCILAMVTGAAAETAEATAVAATFAVHVICCLRLLCPGTDSD